MQPGKQAYRLSAANLTVRIGALSFRMEFIFAQYLPVGLDLARFPELPWCPCVTIRYRLPVYWSIQSLSIQCSEFVSLYGVDEMESLWVCAGWVT